MNNIMGHFTELVKTTKRNKVQPDKVSVTPPSIHKGMSAGGSGKTEVMAHPWRLVDDCSKHMQLPREMHGG